MDAPDLRHLDEPLRARTALLRELSALAGAFTLRGFQQAGLAVESKADGSPVTETDRGCEELLRRRIRAAFPDDGLLGEEHGEEPGRSRWRWVIDPIDGTVSFARGVPAFGTLIAVEDVGGAAPQVVAGSCELPALGERVWAARGAGAWWDRAGRATVRARVSGVGRLADALVGTTGWEYFRRAGTMPALDALAAAAGRVRGWSDCWCLALVATGRCDAAVEPWMNPWDSGPFAVIVEEAGGAFSAWDGTPGIHRRTAVAANPALHAELVRMLARYAE
jgi:histidinol phosphatase-like enzyme (inositol monophosphatase family)